MLRFFLETGRTIKTFLGRTSYTDRWTTNTFAGVVRAVVHTNRLLVTQATDGPSLASWKTPSGYNELLIAFVHTSTRPVLRLSTTRQWSRCGCIAVRTHFIRLLQTRWLWVRPWLVHTLVLSFASCVIRRARLFYVSLIHNTPYTLLTNSDNDLGHFHKLSL